MTHTARAAASDEQHHATLEMVSRFAAISTAAQIQFA